MSSYLSEVLSFLATRQTSE